MFLFQILNIIDNWPVRIYWCSKNGLVEKTIACDAWNIPWFLYLRRVEAIDKVKRKDPSLDWYWVINLK